ncbi:hypothetical protein C1Y18_29385 [Pseudomonas sp. MPR-R5A]|nr:hypothetical protein C1Y25_29575 [Pseudomonas sp. MPBC4-3]PMX39474.1 hypothetical protein C1Y20_32215 [Pseudomonas sp. FW301-21B01]PMY02669.1 hypothetical protein C1Y18_29385 [Pseudomonas sp. MPR-R5A]PNA60660.1 hypothetical protein C1Y14_30020 [Pseudomonas sp. MPR-R5B]
MLAKNVNDNACFLNQRGACEFFASKLAPTEGDVRHKKCRRLIQPFPRCVPFRAAPQSCAGTVAASRPGGD